MTVEKAQHLIAKILLILDAADGEHPSGHVYARVLGECPTLSTYNSIIAIGEKMGFWTVKPSHLVVLTDKGREAATAIATIVDEAAAEVGAQS